MAIAKHIEITAESDKSFEDAVRNGIAAASRTVSGITAAWVKDQTVLVKNDAVATFRVNLKISFVLRD